MEAVREEKALLYQEIHWQQISAQVPTALPKERTLVVPFGNSRYPFGLVSDRFCWYVCVDKWRWACASERDSENVWMSSRYVQTSCHTLTVVWFCKWYSKISQIRSSFQTSRRRHYFLVVNLSNHINNGDMWAELSFLQRNLMRKKFCGAYSAWRG